MALPGVKIGNYHCYNQWGCYLAEKDIGFPKTRTHLIEIPGRDGYLDLTESLRGRPIFDNVPIKIKLLYKAKYDRWDNKLAEITSAIHGRRMPIVFDDDQSYTYYGRCEVSVEKINKWECYIIIDVDADPYKSSTQAKYSQSMSLTNGVTARSMNILETAGWPFHVKVVITSTVTDSFNGSVTISAPGYRTKTLPFRVTTQQKEFDFSGSLAYCGTDRSAIVRVNSVKAYGESTYPSFTCTVTVTEARLA